MVASPEEIPVSIEPAVGWRAWRLVREHGELRLGSLVHGGSWKPQQAPAAVCAGYRRGAHAAPREHCTCGYYATNSWESLCAANVFGNDVGVIGAIGMWGTVIEHGRGARSEFAYPARLRLVCAPCIKSKAVRDPVVVIDVGGGALSPRCARHATDPQPGIPAKAIEWELLNTYGVELLPRPAITRGVRWGLTFEKGIPKPAQIGTWVAVAIFTAIRFVISAVMVLWMLGLVLAIVGAIVGGVFNLATGKGNDPTSTSSVAGQKVDTVIHTLDTYISGSQRRMFVGFEPHRGAPPVPLPPNIALTCGVGRGDHVEFVRCSDTEGDLVGFGEQSDPKGVAKDCTGPTDAYSSGPHWHVCWMALGDDVWIVPFPSSPNPFVSTLGGALFHGDR
jgi:hypothetical protein